MLNPFCVFVVLLSKMTEVKPEAHIDAENQLRFLLNILTILNSP